MPETQPSFELIREIDQLQELARDWTRLFPQAASQAEHWLKVLGQVEAHVREDTCRLAVVGAVKSGKSTMINALVGQDLLRRGAGILTAMITRVQPSPSRGRSCNSRIGAKSTLNSSGPWGCCPTPAWWSGRRSWICSRPKTGSC